MSPMKPPDITAYRLFDGVSSDGLHRCGSQLVDVAETASCENVLDIMLDKEPKWDDQSNVDKNLSFLDIPFLDEPFQRN